MSTVLAVLQSAYRRGGILAAGVNLNAVQKNIGLERLQGWYERMANDGLFGVLTDKYLTSADAYEAGEFERVVNTAAAAITYPATVVDDFSGEDRTPRDMCVISTVVPGADPVIKVYDAAMASWYAIQAITINGYAPLSFKWDDHLKNLVALHLCDETGFDVPPLLATNVKLARVAFAARHGSPRRPVQHEFY